MPSTLYQYFKKAFFKTELSQSTVDPFSGLLSGPIDRQFLLRAYPKDSSGAEVALDIGSVEYVSQPSDNPFKVFPSYLQTPFNFSIGLDPNDFTGFASIAANVNRVSNLGGVLDSYLDLDWLGARVDTFLGPREPAPLTDFTQILKGYAKEVNKDGLHAFLINSRDASFKLQNTSVQRNRYKGFGSAVRLNGSTTKGSGTFSCPAGSMSIGLRVFPSTTSSVARFAAGYRGNIGGGFEVGRRQLSFRGSGSNVFSAIVCNDAGTNYLVDYNGLPANDWYDAFLVLDIVALKLRLYLWNSAGVGLGTDGLIGETTVAGTFNTVRTTVNFGYDNENLTAFFPGDLDEYSIWNIALTGDQIKRIKDRQLAGVETGLIAYWKCDEGSGTTLGNTIPAGPSITLTSPTWVGSLEGDSSLVSTVKPVAVGVRRQVEPKWVDTQRLVVQWHDGSMQALTAVRDSGDSITFGADVSDIYASTPSAGTYNTCLAKGLSRFGSSPVGIITGDVKGANGGSLGYAETTSSIHRKLLVDYGDQNPINDIDDSAFDALETLNPAIVGEYFSEEISVYDACNKVLRNINAWGGATRIGVHTVGRIDDPASLVPTVNWTEDDLLLGGEFRASGLDQSVPVKEVVLGYRPYAKTLSADQVAGIVSLSNRVDFGEQYRYVSFPIVGANPDGKVLTILTSMDSIENAQEELERIAPFLARLKEGLIVQLKEGALTYFVGTIVSLLIQEVDYKGDIVERFGGVKNYVILRVDESITAQGETIRLLLLG